MNQSPKRCPSTRGQSKFAKYKAGNGSRTRDIDLGKVALYH